MIVCDVEFAEPCVEIFLTKLVNVSMAANLDLVLGLDDVNSIEHIQKALPFDGHGELFIKHAEENV